MVSIHNVRAAALCALLAGFSGCTSMQACRTSDCANDDKITADVGKRINAVPALAFDHITVQTIDGVVYLHGGVDTVLEDELAAELAAVPMAKDVDDELYVNTQ